MNVVILGAGRRGARLARHLIEEKKSVVIIDWDNERCSQIMAKLDLMAICGSATDISVLEEAGAKVEKAWNGQEAVALFFQKPAGSFDAILMDVMMPVMDGMEATQRIRDLKREDAASIPIIAMTAQTTADIRETCRKAGMDDYIAKPICEEELAKVIRKSWKAKKV